MSEEQTSQPISLTRPVLTEIDGIKYDLAREGQPAWPGGPPTTPPHPDWTDNEKWCWERIHRGEEADLNVKLELEERLHPKDEELWTADVKQERLLSPEFLRMVLLREPWRGAAGDGGVRIVGAYFDRAIELNAARVVLDFWLDFCWQERDFLAASSIWEGVLSFEGSRIKGLVNLTESKILGFSNFSRGGRYSEVRLVAATIGGNIDMSRNSAFEGELKMGGMVANKSLIMNRGSCFAKINLGSAKISDHLEMSQGSWFCEKLILNSAIIGSSLHMQKGSKFKYVDLCWTKVKGGIDLRGAKIAEKLDMRACEVGGDILFQARHSNPPSWHSNAKIVLKRAKTGAIHDSIDAWPFAAGSIDLEGLTYNYLGGHDSGPENQLATRPGGWFVAWLAKSVPFSPQPYQQCAKVLRAAGHPGKANKVLHAMFERKRERIVEERKAGWWWRDKWMAAQREFIGYGLGVGYLRALGWAGVLVAIGWFFSIVMLNGDFYAPVDQNLIKKSAAWWLGFSLDQTIPLVELAKEHTDLYSAIKGFPHYWFMFQKLAGWFLALLVIAGLTGLVGRKEE